MSEADVVLAALIFLAAALYSTVGHGGASGYLAAMALFGLAPEAMRPAALSLNAAVATYRYARAGQNDLRLLWRFALASAPARSPCRRCSTSRWSARCSRSLRSSSSARRQAPLLDAATKPRASPRR